MKMSLFLPALVLVIACDSGDAPKPDKTAKTGEAPKAQASAADKAPSDKAPKAAAVGPKKPVKAELLDPSKANDEAPGVFFVKLVTTKGDVRLKVTRAWAPHGADRFYNLVKIGFFEDVALFRVVDNFMVQFGIHGDPRVSGKWSRANLPADDVEQSNKRGFITYAMAGAPTTRATQMFINYKDNSSLDKQGFAPFGEVVAGMDIVDGFYKGYGEKTTGDQGKIVAKGNGFLRSTYPKLDYIKSAAFVNEEGVIIKVGDVEVTGDSVKAGNVKVDKDGVKAGGVVVDKKGVKVPGGVKIGDEGLKVPGL